jgi:osmoprotectant transport system substrate-binding protein
MVIARRGALALGATALAAALSLAGCSNSSSLSGSKDSSSGSASSGSSSSTASKSLVIGSTPYPETQALAQIYGQVLAKNGYTVTYKMNVGQRAVLIPALKKGEVNFTPEYAGSLANFLGNKKGLSDAAAAKAVLDTQLKADDLTALEPAEATDADALNVTSAFAKKYSLTTYADLKKAGSVTLAANPEFKTRPDGLKALKSIYGLDNIKFKAINDGGGQGTVKALVNNQVQVADIYTTSPLIAQNKLVTLKDDKGQFGPQNIVPVVSTSKVDSKLTDLVNGVSAKLSQAELVKIDEQVFTKKVDPAAEAKTWISEQGL